MHGPARRTSSGRARSRGLEQVEPVKVGVLFSQSGCTSHIGLNQLRGTLQAIEEINEAGGAGGREIVPVARDARSDPAAYAFLAEQLIADEGVNVLFGAYMSSSRKALIPVIEKWDKLLFYPTLYEGFEFSPNIVYTGAAPNQNSVQLAEFMTTHFGARVYLVGSDYIYPYESNRIMVDLISQQPGGAKLGEQYVPLDAGERDFLPIVQDIRARQPDFVFSTLVGDSAAAFYRAYAEAGIDPRKSPIASLTTSEVELEQMGHAVAAGHFTSSPYFQSVDSEVNRRCIRRLKARFGDDAVASMLWEAAYFQVHLFANALAAAGSERRGDLLPHLLGAEFDAPQGRVKIDPQTQHTCLYPRIGRAASNGGFVIVREATRRVHPDPYLVTHSLGDRTQVLSDVTW
nr:transporter substrate-binding domain-containing protein [Cupriavidus sp. USMAA2-4]